MNAELQTVEKSEKKTVRKRNVRYRTVITQMIKLDKKRKEKKLDSLNRLKI